MSAVSPEAQERERGRRKRYYWARKSREDKRCRRCGCLISWAAENWCLPCWRQIESENVETPHDRIRREGKRCACGAEITDIADSCRVCGPATRAEVKWTDEEILAGLARFGNIHAGRFPTQEEIQECAWLPAPATIRRRWGSTKQVAQMLGLRGGEQSYKSRSETTPSQGRHDRSRQKVTGGRYGAKRDITYTD